MIAQRYGDWYPMAKEKVIKMFTTYKQPQDIRQVTDLISTIINTPSGKRDLVYSIGLGMLETPIREMNVRSEQMSATVASRCRCK